MGEGGDLLSTGEKQLISFARAILADPRILIDILNVDQWEFYVVPTYVINEYTKKYNNPNQKKISFGVVRSLSSGAVKFDGIRAAVDNAIDASDAYYREKA